MQPINESGPSCALPALVQHAYRIGGPVSSLSYSLPLQVLQPRWVVYLTSLPSFTIQRVKNVLGWLHNLCWGFVWAKPQTLKMMLFFFFPGLTFLWMSELELMRDCFSSLLPEEGALTLLYTYPKAGSDYLWPNRRRSSTGRSTTMGSGTRSVDSYIITVAVESLHQQKWTLIHALMCLMMVLLVGHIQFGEEEISVGCGWNQSTGWSADNCWVDIYAALFVPCVPGQRPRVYPQGAEGKQ